MAVDAWDGRPLGEPPISLGLLMSGPSGEGSPPTVAFAAASSDAGRCVMRPEQIGPFLLVHQGSQLICHDSASFHWAIRGLLGPGPGSGTLEALWAFSREGRLLDVRLLDQLLELARGVSAPLPRRLPDLAAHHGIGMTEEDGMVPRVAAAAGTRPVVVERLGADAVGIADAILAIYRRLRDAAGQIIAELGIEPEAAGRFGPLGLGIEVRGAIALARAARTGLRLRADLRAELDELCTAAYRESSARLHEDPWARKCFRWDGPEVGLKKGKFPDAIRDNLEGWLERTAGDITGLHAIPLEPPRIGSGRVASDPDLWGIEARCHPLLAAWSRLTAAANFRWGLAHLDVGGDRRLRPRYEGVPSIRSSNPSLSAVRRLHPAPMFEAAPGRSLLIVALRDLELRCAAEVTRRHGGESQLAGWFHAGVDPVAYAAVRLHESEALRWEEFLALEEREPDRCRRWKAEAQTFLLTVIRGLTVAQAREILRNDHDIDIDAVTARRYYEILADEVGLERPYFRAEDTFEAVRARLGCPVEDLVMLMMPGEPEEAEAALRNLIAGRTRAPDAFARLHAICRDPALREWLAKGEGSAELYEAFFARDVLTPSGRVRGRMFFTQARSAGFLDLADAVRKAALYAVVAEGHELTACADDQFVIEIPEGVTQDDTVEEIGITVEEAASVFLGDVEGLCAVRRVEVW